MGFSWWGKKKTPETPQAPATPPAVNQPPQVPAKPEEPKKPTLPATRPDTPWYIAARKFFGKKETDPEFQKIMVPLWKKLFGMNLGTIATNSTAWCGLAMAAALFWGGQSWINTGALAKNWIGYGTKIEWKIDGIPKSAIVQINHNGVCGGSSGNHVAQAEGDCAPSDLVEMIKGIDGVWRPSTKLKAGGTIDLYGGNQGNMWKVSNYSIKEICAVRWPKDYPFPPPITISIKCNSAGSSGDSTR